MIKINHLNLTLGERRLKFEESLCFPEGSITFVKGESGAGKTTLLYILGMISKQKDYQLFFNHQLINKQSKKEQIRKNEIGMLYQNFNVLEDLTLYQNLKLFADINSTKLTNKRAKKLLKMFHLNVKLNRKFGSLSGGEKQRFSLACILLKDPSVIIADEPTSALDENNANQLMDLLYFLAKEMNKTIIVSTHSKAYDRMADNIITLYKDHVHQTKRLAEEKEVRKRKTRKLNKNFYLDMAKYRINRMIKRSGLVMALMIIMLSLSVFLINYSHSAKEEYSYYLNTSLENEVFMTPVNEEAHLTEEQIETIKEIPNVTNIFPVYRKFGQLIVDGNDLGFMEVYPVYPFQNAYGQKECAVDNLLYDCLDQDIKLVVAGKTMDLHVANIYSIDKTNMYSVASVGKVFVPYEYLDELGEQDVQKYVLEIGTFFEYDNIVQKVNAITEDYVLQSSYQYFSNLLRNAEQQQLFINLGSGILVLISVLLFVTVQVHEVRDKRKEMCIFQANGLNKNHVFKLEIIENIFKFMIFYLVGLMLSYFLVILGNRFVLKDAAMTINLYYQLTLLGLLIFTVILPALIAEFYMIRQSPENELRYLF